MNHKTQKQNGFCEVQGNNFGDREDYRFLEFYAMWTGSALLKDLLPPSSGQEMIFPKQDKVVKSSEQKP